jgi:hypothetical protein
MVSMELVPGDHREVGVADVLQPGVGQVGAGPGVEEQRLQVGAPTSGVNVGGTLHFSEWHQIVLAGPV